MAFLKEMLKVLKFLLLRQAYVSNAKLHKKSRLGRFVKFTNASIGKYSYVGQGSIINNAKIGSFSSISSGVKIGLGFHPLDLLSTSPVFYTRDNIFKFSFIENNLVKERKTTFIGNDVLISANVFIKDGVSIGNGCVIGAGSVVISDVEDFAIVGGVPARLIRYRFDKNTRDNILNNPFWEWTDDDIRLEIAKFKERLQ